MRRLAILLLFPTTVLALPTDEEVGAAITTLCEQRWPTFIGPQNSCIRKQWDGYAEVREFVDHNRLGYDRDQIRALAEKKEPAAQIYIDCANQWRPNFRALAKCLTEQSDAAAWSDRVMNQRSTLCGGDPRTPCIRTTILCGMYSASRARALRLLKASMKGKASSAALRRPEAGCTV